MAVGSVNEKDNRNVWHALCSTIVYDTVIDFLHETIQQQDIVWCILSECT